MSDAFLSFPPRALLEQSARLGVLYFKDGLLALDKPAGVAVEPHPFWKDAPDLRTALRVGADKPSFAHYGLAAPSGICHLDAAVSGVALFGTTPASVAAWRNVYGSRQLSFTYVFLAEDSGVADAFSCDLPLASHDEHPRALITHTRGRKTLTQFTRGARVGHWSWWRAETDFPRPHQIRLHAAECGLRILGETLYGQTPVPRLSAFKTRFKKRDEEKPLYTHVCAHLETVRLPDGTAIAAPVPKKLALLAEKLARFV